MLKKIDINLGYAGWTKLWAWVDGVYAIHRFGEGWGLTHVPTGMGIGRSYQDTKKGYDKETVLAKLEKYKQLRWRDMNPLEDLEPCELLNLAPLIHEELLGTEFNPVHDDDWRERVQGQAAYALACKIEKKPMTTKEENYQKDRQTRAQYLNDMRKQHRAIKDVFGGIVQWPHKANGYTFPNSEAWNYWRVTRQSPPPF